MKQMPVGQLILISELKLVIKIWFLYDINKLSHLEIYAIHKYSANNYFLHLLVKWSFVTQIGLLYISINLNFDFLTIFAINYNSKHVLTYESLIFFSDKKPTVLCKICDTFGDLEAWLRLYFSLLCCVWLGKKQHNESTGVFNTYIWTQSHNNTIHRGGFLEEQISLHIRSLKKRLPGINWDS